MIDNILNRISELLAIHGPKFLMAVLTLIVGLFLIKMFIKVLRRVMKKREVEESMMRFLLPTISILLKIVLFIAIISMFGVPVASFIAILASIGIAIGMALSGTLQNFAGGIVLMVFKPIRIGDYIEAQGVDGFVDDIQIFVTVLKTLDNKTVFLPNGPLSNSIITNFSIEPKRRIDISFGIGYSDDIDKAKKVLLQVANEDDKIIKKPAPFAEVEALGDNSVNFTLRVWVKKADYWDVYFYLFEAVKKAFDKNGISIPFPQRDVHIYNN